MAAAVDHPGARPDPTGRRLAYLPAAILGNGSLLVTLSGRGEVERMLWPHVDGPDNVRALRLGVPRRGTVAWLDEPPAEWSQAWDGDVSVLRTTVTLPEGRIEIGGAAGAHSRPTVAREGRCRRRPRGLTAAGLLEA